MTEEISFSIRYSVREIIAKTEIVELARVKNRNYVPPKSQGVPQQQQLFEPRDRDSNSESPLLQAKARDRTSSSSSSSSSGASAATKEEEPQQREEHEQHEHEQEHEHGKAENGGKEEEQEVQKRPTKTENRGNKHRGATPYHFVKIISRAGGRIAENYFENEVRVLFNIRHPRIGSLVEYGIEEDNFYIVTEFYGGDTLEKRILTKGTVSEERAAQYTRQILAGLRVLHLNNICHRDIQAKHIVFEDENEQSDLRLVGFQHAAHLSDTDLMAGVPEGNIQYLSPETIENTYTRNGATWRATDIWGVGVLVYWMITGKFPFAAEDNISTKQSIRLASPSMSAEFSGELKDFLKQIFTEVAPRRPTAEAAISHPWIVKHTEYSEDGSEELRPVEGLKLKEGKRRDSCMRNSCTTCGLM